MALANEDKLQAGLDTMFAGLGVLMATQPETVPVALPTLGLVKGAKPYAKALGIMGCVNSWQSQVPAFQRDDDPTSRNISLPVFEQAET